jgi:Kef-type K+ transport system membrane component KefB
MLLLLPLIIIWAKIAGALAKRVGQPSVFGELLAGLILGPTFLNVLGWPVFVELPETGAHPSGGVLQLVRDFAEIGVLLLMFVAGLETDLAEVRRVGKVAFWAAVGGVGLPMIAGTGTAAVFGMPLYWEAIFLGTILTATSVSISAQTLLELGALRSREGSTILGAAVIDDVMGILVLSFIVAFAKASADGVDLAQIGMVVLRVCGYFALAVVVGRWFGPLLRWGDRLRVSQGVLATALAVALVYAWAAEYLGAVAAITGAYLAGVLIARTPYKKQVDAGIHPLTYTMFVPVFFVSIGLQANARALGGHAAFTLALVVVAVLAKIVGAGGCARAAGFTTLQSTRVGVGMVSRGEVGLIIAGYGLTNGLIGPEVFSAAVIMVLVTTMVTPPLLRLVFPRGVAVPDGPIEETIARLPPEVAAPGSGGGSPPASHPSDR